MERKVLVCMVSLFLFILSSNVQAQDPCQKFHDKYQVCLEKRDAGYNVDYNACRTYGNHNDCVAHDCYWNPTGLPVGGACVANVCYADSNADGYVDGNDLGVYKKDLFRVECPKTPTNPGYLGAPVPKTGQTELYATGDDGDLEKGIAWPNPRFTDNGNGTVTDNLTGLIWLKNANCSSFGAPESWADALSDCNGLSAGYCGLTDGSIAGDWRLPNRSELNSLVDVAYYNPALSNTAGTGQWSPGNPFTNVQSNFYWSSSTFAYVTGYAWGVSMYYGVVISSNKTYSYYVWPVRGGQ